MAEAESSAEPPPSRARRAGAIVAIAASLAVVAYVVVAPWSARRKALRRVATDWSELSSCLVGPKEPEGRASVLVRRIELARANDAYANLLPEQRWPHRCAAEAHALVESLRSDALHTSEDAPLAALADAVTKLMPALEDGKGRVSSSADSLFALAAAAHLPDAPPPTIHDWPPGPMAAPPEHLAVLRADPRFVVGDVVARPTLRLVMQGARSTLCTFASAAAAKDDLASAACTPLPEGVAAGSTGLPRLLDAEGAADVAVIGKGSGPKLVVARADGKGAPSPLVYTFATGFEDAQGHVVVLDGVDGASGFDRYGLFRGDVGGALAAAKERLPIPTDATPVVAGPFVVWTEPDHDGHAHARAVRVAGEGADPTKAIDLGASRAGQVLGACDAGDGLVLVIGTSDKAPHAVTVFAEHGGTFAPMGEPVVPFDAFVEASDAEHRAQLACGEGKATLTWVARGKDATTFDVHRTVCKPGSCADDPPYAARLFDAAAVPHVADLDGALLLVWPTYDAGLRARVRDHGEKVLLDPPDGETVRDLAVFARRRSAVVLARVGEGESEAIHVTAAGEVAPVAVR